MKAVTAVCTTSGSNVSGVSPNGRIHRQRRDVENEEIQMYLSKLKELVPFMPKNRRLSKLEVIQYVIDYICDLQYALETHPSVATAVNNAVTTAAATVRHTSATNASTSPRQPLGVLAPNTINPNTSCTSQEQITTTPVHLEKVAPTDTRPVSC